MGHSFCTWTGWRSTARPSAPHTLHPERLHMQLWGELSAQLGGRCQGHPVPAAALLPSEANARIRRGRGPHVCTHTDKQAHEHLAQRQMCTHTQTLAHTCRAQTNTHRAHKHLTWTCTCSPSAQTTHTQTDTCTSHTDQLRPIHAHVTQRCRHRPICARHTDQYTLHAHTPQTGVDTDRHTPHPHTTHGHVETGTRTHHRCTHTNEHTCCTQNGAHTHLTETDTRTHDRLQAGLGV